METTNVGAPTNYANFGYRLLAYLIDGVIITIAFYALTAILGAIGFSAFGGAEALEGFDPDMPDPGMMGAIMGAGMGVIGIALITSWLYFALMESSAKQATVGKMALQLKVTDLYGNRISFMKATGRFFGKIVSQAILYIGFIMQAFTAKKQALHDMMAGTLVLKG